MDILIRADSSLQMGVGHVMRCLSIARELRALGAKVRFASAALPGHINAIVEKDGFSVLPADAREKSDWLLVDHYGLGREYEVAMRSFARRIAVIDDLANRVHDCDILLDASYRPREADRYAGLVPESAKLLLGPAYALLRAEFAELRPRIRAKREIKKVLVFWGGTDHINATEKSMHALRHFPDLSAQFVVGGTNPHIARLGSKLCPRHELLVQVENFGELMIEADIFLGAAGGNLWERFCLGLSSLSVAVENNQVGSAEALAREGYHFYLGRDLDPDAWQEAIEERLGDVSGTLVAGVRSMELVDGLGIKRFAQALLSG